MKIEWLSDLVVRQLDAPPPEFRPVKTFGVTLTPPAIWRLEKPLLYRWTDESSVMGLDGDVKSVPKGFVTDFASVPWFAWRIVPPVGRYNKAAVLHDYLGQGPIQYPKMVRDNVFKAAMAASGVPKWRRNLMFWSVRLFGPKRQ